MESGLMVLSIYCAHMATKWDRLLELRPRQGKDMSVQAYYDEFCIWKEKMEEQNYLADEQSYVDDFLCWLKWDLVVRVWSYKSKPQKLSDALQRARFEESMMKIEAYFHTPVVVNEVADSNPTLVKEISIQDAGGVANENSVNEGNKEDFSDVIDEGHLQILQMKAKEGKVFDEMSHPISVDVMEIQEDWSVLKSKLGDITQSNTLNVVDDSPEDANMDETRNEVELKIMDNMAPNTTQVIKIPISPAILTDKYVQDNQSSMLVDDKLCLDKLYLRLDAITNSLLPNPWYACEKYVQNGEKLGTKFICQSNSTTHRECKGVILLIDTVVMFYFDPGGCHLPQMGCDLFELNGEQGDHCFTTNVDDASVRFDEYCNDAFSGESVSPFSKFVPILELAMSIQIGFIMKAYVVLIHAGMLPNRELRQVFVEWNREEFPILMIEETIIIVKTSSDLKDEWSSTTEFLNDRDFWWISLFVYLNTIEERGSRLGAHIHVRRVVQNDICLLKGLKPLVLWLKTGELDGSLLDENFTQPPQLFCKWIVWRIASLTVRSLSKARFGVAHLTGIQEIGEPYDILVKQIGLIVDFQAGSMRESETYFSGVLARMIYRLFSSSQNESALLNLLQMHFHKSYSYVKLAYLTANGAKLKTLVGKGFICVNYYSLKQIKPLHFLLPTLVLRHAIPPSFQSTNIGLFPHDMIIHLKEFCWNLALMGSEKELASAVKLIRENMGRKQVSEMSLEWLMSAFGSEPESPWKRISELVLGDDSDLWVDIFGEAFLHRMEAIIHTGFEELMQFQCKASILDDQVGVNECSVDASGLDHLKHGNVLLMSMIGLSKVPRKSGVLMRLGLCTIFVYILEDKDVLKRKGIGVRLVLKQDEWLNGTGIHYNPHMKFLACFLVDWELLSQFITSSKFRIGKLNNLMGLFVTSFDYNCLRFNNDYSSSNQTSWIGCKGFDLEDAIDVNDALSVIWVLVQTKWDNNCQGAFQSYPPAVSVNAQILNGFLHINSYRNINVLKLDDSVMATLLATLFKLGYAVVTTPLKAMLRVFISMLFWKHQWGCRKAFGLVAVGILENFVWDPGLVWVSHFTTLRTRRLLRGRICHVPRFKN